LNKDNKIILFAVIILLVSMVSYNSFNSDFSATGKATTTFEKCSIRQAGWSSSPDSLEKITQIKQGQTVYMYISTNNCAGEEITFELYRLRKRFLLKDSLVLVGSSTKTVSSSNKLSNPVVASINTEDGTSSNYRFRVRLTKYLTTTNTTNTTTPPPPTTTNTTNQTNTTVLPSNTTTTPARDILWIAVQTYNPITGVGWKECPLNEENPNLVCEDNINDQTLQAGTQYKIYTWIYGWSDSGVYGGSTRFNVKYIKLIGPLPSTNVVAETSCIYSSCVLNILAPPYGSGGLAETGKYLAITAATPK